MPRRPPEPHLRYLIPGYVGAPESEWIFTRIVEVQEGGKIVKKCAVNQPQYEHLESKVGVLKGLPEFRGFSYETLYPVIRFEYSKKPIKGELPGSKLNFNQMCVKSAVRIGISGAAGGPAAKFNDFLIFAALFAAENPELWKELSAWPPPPAHTDKLPDAKVRIPSGLGGELDTLAKKNKVAVGSIVRASASWLGLQLAKVPQSSTANDQGSRFFKPFLSGKNEKAAKDFPVRKPVPPAIEGRGVWEMTPEMIEDFYDVEESYASAMDRWQAKRRKLLRWPSPYPRVDRWLSGLDAK
jgi:hypothetical protein